MRLRDLLFDLGVEIQAPVSAKAAAGWTVLFFPQVPPGMGRFDPRPSPHEHGIDPQAEMTAGML